MAQANDNLITNEALNCFENLLKELGIKSYKIEISPGSKRGENYSGTVAKAEVTGKDKSYKTTSMTFIIKCAVQSENYRALIPVRQSFIREAYIYSTVLPEFLKFQDKQNIAAPFKSFAKFYKSTLEVMNETVIMEDVKQFGFQTCERKKTLDYDHVRLAVQVYGRFHALSFALRDQKPDVFEVISKNTGESFFSGENGGNFFDSVKPQVLRVFDVFSPNFDEEIYKRLSAFVQNIRGIVVEVLSPSAAGSYAVINHGDCWMNNWLFKYADSEKPHTPTDMCLLDWQLARTGSPALDLSYFLFTCTDKELRDNHYNDLINEYYSTLCNNIRELGSDPERLFPYNILQEHLKKFSIYGLFMSLIVLFMMTSEVDEIPDMHQVTDLQDMNKMLSYESRNIEKYNERIRGVILDYVRFGYEL